MKTREGEDRKTLGNVVRSSMSAQLPNNAFQGTHIALSCKYTRGRSMCIIFEDRPSDSPPASCGCTWSIGRAGRANRRFVRCSKRLPVPKPANHPARLPGPPEGRDTEDADESIAGTGEGLDRSPGSLSAGAAESRILADRLRQDPIARPRSDGGGGQTSMPTAEFARQEMKRPPQRASQFQCKRRRGT